MNRRQLLAAGTATTFPGIAGCISGLDRSDRNDTDDEPNETEPSECTQKEEWPDVTGGPADPDPNSIAGRRGCANAERPEPTGDVCTTFEDQEGDYRHSLGVEPYPGPPDSFDEESMIDFLYEYERAYSRNSAVESSGENQVHITFSSRKDRTKKLDYYDEIDVFRIEYGLVSYQYSPGRGEDHLDAPGQAVAYGIDETGLVRSYIDGGHKTDVEETPDPVEDGELLQCF